MSVLTKVFIVLTSVMCIALSCLFVASAAQWENWRALADNLQKAKDAAIAGEQSAVATAQASLAMKDQQLAANGEKMRLAQDEVQRLKDQNSQLTSDLALLRNKQLESDADRKKLQEILDVATGEMKALQKQNQSLLTQNIDLQSRMARLNSRVLELTTSVTILQDQNRNVQEKLYACEQQVAQLEKGETYAAAPTDELGLPGATAVAPTVTGEIRGSIIEIDGVYGTINVGESVGVVPGMTFMVYREGGTYLGDLVIERVTPGQAGGRLTTLAESGVRKGDAVVYGIN